MTATKNEVTEVPQWGPKMLALANDKQRAFVEALYDEEAPARGKGLFGYAVRKAGYGTATSSDVALRVTAHRLFHDDRVREAIAEYSRNLVRAISPEAVKAIRAAIGDPKHKDHIRAAAMILDRVDPLVTTHNVKVEHSTEPATIEATEKVLARIEDLARRAGLVKPVIDGECRVLSEETP